MPNLELASPVETYACTWGSTSGLILIRMRAVLSTAFAASAMFTRSNSESTLMSAPFSIARRSSAGSFPFPLKIVLHKC